VPRPRVPDIIYGMDTLEQQLRAKARGGQRPPVRPKFGDPDLVIQRKAQPKSGYRPKPDSERRKHAPPLTEDERDAICALVLDGNSYSKVGQLTGRSSAVIARVLKDRNVVPMHPTPEASRAAMADYTLERRRVLLNKMFDAIEFNILPTVERAGDMKDLAIATGIMIDKTRLEEGAATSITETGKIGDARVSLATKIDAIVRNRESSTAMTTYEATDEDQKAPGELVELERVPVYDEEDDPNEGKSPWGIIGE
jgi:hypothetical protein